MATSSVFKFICSKWISKKLMDGRVLSIIEKIYEAEDVAVCVRNRGCELKLIEQFWAGVFYYIYYLSLKFLYCVFWIWVIGCLPFSLCAIYIHCYMLQLFGCSFSHVLIEKRKMFLLSNWVHQWISLDMASNGHKFRSFGFDNCFGERFVSFHEKPHSSQVQRSPFHHLRGSACCA